MRFESLFQSSYARKTCKLQFLNMSIAPLFYCSLWYWHEKWLCPWRRTGTSRYRTWNELSPAHLR